MNKDFTVKLEGDAWKELIHHCFEHKKNEVNVDGFRKGQVPFDVYVKKFGVESLYMDAVDHALPELYDKLLEENEGLVLNMACRPEVNIKNISMDSLEVVFTVTMKPEVKLGKYKDLGIKKEEVTVTEEEINDELEHLRGHYAEYKEKDGAVELTDEANINYEGFKGGVAFEGGKGENYPLVIGSNTFIPGFEEGLIGMKKGETKSINLKFPENYHSEELKGQEVVFNVTVNSIKQRILPEYNEDFFKDLNMDGVTDLDSLKENIKSHILGHKTQEVEDKYFDEVLTKISEEAKMDIPEGMINEETDRIVDQFNQNLQYQGMNIDTYLKMLNITIEEFKKNFTPEAEKRVKYRLVLEQIVKEEGITVEESELNDYAKDMAKKYNVTEEVFLKEIGGLDFLKYDLEVRKALEIVTGK